MNLRKNSQVFRHVVHRDILNFILHNFIDDHHKRNDKILMERTSKCSIWRNFFDFSCLMHINGVDNILLWMIKLKLYFIWFRKLWYMIYTLPLILNSLKQFKLYIWKRCNIVKLYRYTCIVTHWDMCIHLFTQ